MKILNFFTRRISMSREVSITAALVEVKNLKKKIDAQLADIDSTKMFYVKTENSGIPGYPSTEAYKNNVKSKFDSLNDRINAYIKLRGKIAAVNAETTVKYDNEEISLAELISRRDQLATVMTQFYDSIERQYTRAKIDYERTTEKNRDRVQTMVESFVSKDKKQDSAEYQAFTAFINKMNAVEFLDPLGYSNKRNELRENLEKKIQEIDILLSETNSSVMITVD